MALVERPTVVGRDEPRERLARAIGAAAAGRRTAILVSGQAGIGKTSLVRAALDDVRTAGAGGRPPTPVIGWGTCWHGEGAPGFWPCMQAFDDLVRAVGRPAARAAAEGDRGRVAVLVRDLGPVPEPTDDPDHRRVRLLDATLRWLERLARDRPVVVVIDDLQWADASTLDLLDHLVGGSSERRLLVVGAYRHDELATETEQRLAVLGSHAEHLHLEGLDPAAVEQLVAAVSDPEHARAVAPALHRRTGGHPLFVRELALAPPDATALPTAVIGALGRRLDGLPAASRRILDVASVLGNQLLPDVLGAVVEMTAAEVVDHLEAPVAARVVREGVGAEWWFAHDLYREALDARLSHGERTLLHARIGEALEARQARSGGVAPADLARHFSRAVAVTGAERALHWAGEAARDERRRAAFRESAAHLRRVRRAVADAGAGLEPAVLVSLLLDEADAEARSGEPGTARHILEEAGSAATEPAHVVDVALAVQRLGAKFATPRDEVIAHLEAALEAITGLDTARQARVTAALARELQHSVAEDRERAAGLSEQALALGRHSDDATLVACLLARHDALWEPGSGLARSELAQEIAGVGGRLRDTDRLMEGLLLQANGLLEAGSPGFRPVLDRWLGLVEARNEPRDRYLALTRRAALALLAGDPERSEHLMAAAAALGHRIHEPDTGNVLMSQRVALARLRGEPAELATLAVDAVSWWRGAPGLAHAVAAGAYAAAGDVDAAAREVAMSSAAGGWRSEGSYLRSVLLVELAEAAVALHDRQLCAELLRDLVPLSGACGVNGAVVAFAGPFDHVAGLISAELGDHAAAERRLRRSVETARGLGAAGWTRQSLAVLERLRAAGPAAPEHQASLCRTGSVWTFSFGDETGSLPHAKGLADIAHLVRHRGRDVAALQLAGTTSTTVGDAVIDLDALRAYRARLADLDAELDTAGADNDLAALQRCTEERDLLLAEVRRVTGLGGRIRDFANDPAERARKAVSGRIRDVIRRLGDRTPLLAAHLDRSVRTGLCCSYDPPEEDSVVRWVVSE